MYRISTLMQSRQEDSYPLQGRHLFDALPRRAVRFSGVVLLPALLSLSLVEAAAAADDPAPRFQDHASIYRAAEAFIRSETSHYSIEPEITIGQLDKRLNVARCEEPLQPFLRPGARMAGNTSIGIKCRGERPWTAYLSASIHLYDKIAVASRPLPRGTRLQQSDLTLVEQEISSLSRGFFNELPALEGQILKQSLKPDTVITPAMVKPPLAVKRREGVVIVAGTGAITIRTQGEAMADGAIGDRIKVKNRRSQRIIDATVIEAGVVEVSL